MIKISVCIATWNRKEMLCEIIEQLEHQTMKQDEYEIIVVDSNSSDGTYLEIRKLMLIYKNIVYIQDAPNILAAKRNIGIKFSRSEIIVFMDDDVYPNNNFLEAHYRANLENECTFYCGQIRFDPYKVKTSNYYRFRDEQHLGIKDVDYNLKFNQIVVMNLSFKKKFLRKTGFVNENFLGYGCEDMDFGYRVISSGFDIKYLPEAKCIHNEKSSDIIQYGVKLYKTGLYGERALRKYCFPAYKKLHGKTHDFLGLILSLPFIKHMLSKYLLMSDSNPKLYNYYLYKAYLYSCLYSGKRDQKKYPPLSNNDIKKGW